MLVKACLVALLSGQAADVATTARAIRSGQFHEANPALPSSVPAIVAVKGGSTAALAVLGWKMRKAHPKLAAVIFVAAGASGAYGAAANARAWARR